MRYTGPRGKAFSGDKAKAQSLQRAADLLVGRVIQRLKAPPFNGRGHLVDRKRLDDGSWIGCMVNMVGMQPIIRTWVESPTGVDVPPTYSPITLLDTTAGFLQLGYLDSPYKSALTEYPVIYQSPRTKNLYSKFGNNAPWVDMEPISYWFDRNDPPANYAVTLTEKIAHTPGRASMSSGKARLYQQARRGLQLVYPAATIADSGYNIGVWRDQEFRYWHVIIEHWDYTPRVRFIKFNLPVEYVHYLDELKFALATGDSDAELVCESNVLSYLELSGNPNEAYSVRIKDEAGELWMPPAFQVYNEVSFSGGSWTIPSPINGGWNFNWDGDRACTVLLEQVRAGGSTFLFSRWADMRSHVLELAFSNSVVDGELVFSAIIEEVEINDWYYNHGWGYWFASTTATTTNHWQIREQTYTGDASHPMPTNTPLYGFYTGTTFKNNTLSLVRFSFSHEEINNRTATCANDTVYGFFDGSFKTGFFDIKSGRHQNSLVTFGGISKAGEKLPGNQHRTAEVGVTGSWVPLDVWFTEMDPPVVFSYLESTSMCGRSTEVKYWGSSKPSRYKVEKFLVDGSISVIESNTTDISSASPVFFPHNVEAFAIAKSERKKVITTTNTNTYLDTSVEWGGAAVRIALIQSSDDRGESWYTVSDSPNPGGDATYWYMAAQTGSSSSTTVTGGTSGEIVVFGKNARTVSFAFTGGVDEIIPPHYFCNFREILLPTWEAGLRLSQGVGPEMGIRLTCNDGGYQVRDEYRFMSASYAGYPERLLTDPNAECLGFA